MVGGGGGWRDGETAVWIGSGNVFAALEELKNKNKLPSSASSSSASGNKGKDAKGSKKAAPEEKKPPPAVFWPLAPLKSKSCGDVYDEEDEEYFATTVPPRPVWGTGPAAVAGAGAERKPDEQNGDGDRNGSSLDGAAKA